MQRDLTKGNVMSSMLLFAGPMIAGNLLQQLYNIADTLIVGRYLGSDALAAVGSSFTLMVFLTSILLGLSMGSGAFFSMLFGAKREEDLKKSIVLSFTLIGVTALIINVVVILCIDPLLAVLQIPGDILGQTKEYLQVIFYGILFTFLYNYFASLLRAIGNSTMPLIFLAISAILNIVLDLGFILWFHMGVAGAAWATIISQAVSAAGIMLYSFRKVPLLHLKRHHFRFDKGLLKHIAQYSFLTCVQQSIMNFGILLIQGLVNSFGVAVMAAFAAAVKIDSFAYMPVQDFGNAFSTFIAQNFGAGQHKRIQKGIRAAVIAALVFCIIISLAVCLFAQQWMLLFVQPGETEVIAIGAQYLRIEGMCYAGIGCLFLLYGLYRGVGKPGISVVLTVISLGTRVILAYVLAPIPAIGLPGIWWAIPIGWVLADITGLVYYRWWSKKSAKMIADLSV